MLVLDTSGLLAAIGPEQPFHKEARHVLETEEGPLLLSPFVLAETDYMILKLAGVRRELQFLRDIGAGGYELVAMSADDVRRAANIAEQYADMRIGLTDASVALVAARHGTTRVLTLDHRHFRTMKPLRGDAFTVLPADGR
ncbi:PIN domain-containing protein [Nonomuraea sp. 3-1Str]|uniref:type II toxin-antitoxin system VapC family toxin n=1 Tax=unclassified Nonomuraea TaxID=2593643 RepID=UPI0028573473|nr:PIN domain-containing protein [Nonomuraea sp. 3-1Str]MDR8410628.1 PIN domain-containing protein [Nonomuraea sp. 3-1Str]